MACAPGNPADPDPDDRVFRERARKCFQLSEPAPSAELLELVTARIRPLFEENLALSPGSLGVLPIGAHAFVSVRLDTVRMIDERGSGGCDNGNRGPNEPTCDPVVGEPTGRKVPSAWTYRVMLGPEAGKSQNSLAPWEALFQPKHLEAFWIHIGEAKDPVFAIDPALKVSDEVSIPPPSSILPKLEAFPFAGPPELRAALLADIALAAFRSGDAEKGRRATAALDALVAAEPVDQPRLALRSTLAALHELASGRWFLADPCPAE